MITWNYSINRHAWEMNVAGVMFGLFVTKEEGYDAYSASIRTA